MSGAAPHNTPMDAGLLAQSVTENFDAVVIGSGAGGAPVCKELAEGGMRVALVEEGAHHTLHRDLGYHGTLRLYRDAGATSTLGKPFIPVPLGKCFGGTTTINSGTCFRTPDYVVQRWREERGLVALDPEEYARCHDRVEREINVEPSDFAVMSRNNTLIHELLHNAGYQGAPLRRNIKNCEGCGMCCYGCTSGAKQSMDRSYLPRAMAAGAQCYTRARAAQILRNADGSAAGVMAQCIGDDGQPTGKTLTLRAPVVVVACGTFITPRLLRQNGIAKRNRHLGKHLTIHPGSKVAAEFPERINNWEGTPQAYYCDVYRDDGIIFEGIAMPPDLGPMAVPFGGARLAHYIKRYPYITSFGFMISDTAEGEMLSLPSTTPLYRYNLTPTDCRRIRKAIVFLARLYLNGGALRVFPMVHTDKPEFTCHADIDAFEKKELRPEHIDMMAFHPLGTARMAARPEDGVCDPWQQCWDAPGVYISDGSVVPSALGVNPQQTIMALATRLSGKLLGKALV